jgi:hypothetical protein
MSGEGDCRDKACLVSTRVYMIINAAETINNFKIMRQFFHFVIGIGMLFPLILAAGCTKSQPEKTVNELSEREFANPPMDARPGALWTWLNGYVKPEQITKELEEMKAKGMRGAIIWDLGSLSDPNKIILRGRLSLVKNLSDQLTML